MVLYSCDNGHTTVDNFDETILDLEKELEAEVFDIEDDYDQQAISWSGGVWDYWPSEYQRPSVM